MGKTEFKEFFFKEKLFKDFYFFNVGYDKCNSLHKFGPSLRENYIIHYIVSGCGEYRVNDVIYELSAGDFFLIRPNELVTYIADEENPWEYYWIGFSGNQVNNFLLNNGFDVSDYTGCIAENNELSGKLQKLLNLDFFNDKMKLSNAAVFLDIFSYFHGVKENNIAVQKEKRSRMYRDSFLLYVKNNYYREDLSIEKIARSMYLNTSYFSQLIKNELGITALDYLVGYRLNRATILLKTTELNIEEIAQAVGYQNRHSFSRAFKKKFNISPTNYRLTN